MNKISQKKIAANRSNAKKSTGPVTVRGKAKARMNGLKSGVFARTRVLPHEDEAAFLALRASLFSEIQPRGVIAEIFVDQVASSIWRLGRLERAEEIFLKGKIQTYATNRQYGREAEAIRNRNPCGITDGRTIFYDGRATEIKIAEMRRKKESAKSQESDLDAVLEDQICHVDDSKVCFFVEGQRQSVIA